MTMRKPFRRSLISRPARRKTHWDRFGVKASNLNAADGNANTFVILTGSAENQGHTLTRTLGQIFLETPSTIGIYRVTWGIIMGTVENVSDPIDPSTDVGPWLILKKYVIDVKSVVDQGATVHEIPFDIKSQRKMTAQSQLVLTIESDGMPNDLTIDIIGRTLLLLP